MKNNLYKFLKQKKQEGFTLIELMVSMGLLAFVMAISMNILSIVLSMTNDADYSVIVTQEANYASERVKRLVRSSDLPFEITDSDASSGEENNVLSVIYNGAVMKLRIIKSGEKGYVFQESKNGVDYENVISSEVYIEHLKKGDDVVPFFELVKENGETVGVRMAFRLIHKNDDDHSAEAFVYTQAMSRNIILNM